MSRYHLEPEADGRWKLYKEIHPHRWDWVGSFKTIEDAKRAAKNLSRKSIVIDENGDEIQN